MQLKATPQCDGKHVVVGYVRVSHVWVVYIYLYRHVCMSLQICTYVCMYVYIQARMHVCMCGFCMCPFVDDA
jgi:hypothetical protein